MSTDVLRIVDVPAGRDDPADEPGRPPRQTDFVVNGQSLSSFFGIDDDRPWFGSTCFQWPADRRDLLLDALLGRAPAQNQLGTGRATVFGCHCGSDYCGVISAEVVRHGDRLIWRDVRHEDDEQSDGAGDLVESPSSPTVIDELVFDAEAVEQEVRRYLDRR